MSCEAQVVYEDSAFAILARVHHNGVNVLQATVAALEYQIFYADSAVAHTTATSLTVASAVFDTLQTDGRWTRDATGYNLRHDVAASVLVDPTRDYEFEYKFTMSDGAEVRWTAPVIRLKAIKSS